MTPASGDNTLEIVDLLLMHESSSNSWRRHLLGILSLALIGCGVYFWIYPASSASSTFLHGASLKSGIVLFVAWLAFPQLDKIPGWLFAALLIFLLIVSLRPRLFVALGRYALFLIPVLIGIWLLRPKHRARAGKRRRATRQSSDSPAQSK